MDRYGVEDAVFCEVDITIFYNFTRTTKFAHMNGHWKDYDPKGSCTHVYMYNNSHNTYSEYTSFIMYTHSHACVYIHIHRLLQIHTVVHKCVHTLKQYTQTDTNTYTYITTYDTCIHTVLYIHTEIHIHTCTYTYMYSCIHTYMHVYIIYSCMHIYIAHTYTQA